MSSFSSIERESGIAFEELQSPFAEAPPPPPSPTSIQIKREFAALEATVSYLEHADEWARERFLQYINSRYAQIRIIQTETHLRRSALKPF